MKQEFSTSWADSVQVRKQRKYRFNAPLHVRQKFMGTHLSKDLRIKHGIRNISVRKGDEVLVMRGSFAKKKGKVLEVDLKKTRVTVEGITRTKRDGSKIPVFFRPHAIQITALNTDDKKRLSVKEKETKHAPNKS
jgi:large subunit ribosomal protein L24